MRGAMAPDVVGTMQGSSVSAVFVTAALALLRSLYPRISATRLRSAILLEPRRNHSVAPPLLDVAKTMHHLRGSA
jgi:hypothetical protein